MTPPPQPTESASGRRRGIRTRRDGRVRFGGVTVAFTRLSGGCECGHFHELKPGSSGMGKDGLADASFPVGREAAAPAIPIGKHWTKGSGMSRLWICVVAALAVGLFVVGGAAADNFPAVTGQAYTGGDPEGFWLVLPDGHSDSVTVGAADISYGIASNPGWSFTMPGGQYMEVYRVDRQPVPVSSRCKKDGFKDIVDLTFLGPWRKITCPIDIMLNLRLGDLNDTFVVANSDLTTSFRISGEDGNDYIRGANGKDTFKGGNGNDVLRTGSAVDNLIGEAGDDLLDGGDGADIMDCGDGTDLVQYQGRVSPLTITLDGAANDGASGENDKIGSSCENVEAWNGADKITGSSGANRLSGRDGNDTIKGGGGTDRLFGGNGKDTLFGDVGSDFLYGDDGDDTIEGGAGTDTIYGGAGNDTINAKDGQKDTIYCGAGTYDAVIYDAGLDEIDIGTCERR